MPTNCSVAVIQGAGLLGLYACALLRERGVKQIFCVDVNQHRLEQVRHFSGIPVDGRLENYPEARQIILQAAKEGVDAVLEVAGVSALVPEGIRLLRAGGYYGFVGMVHPDTRLEITGEQIIRKCLTVQGTHNYAPWHLDQAIAFLEKTHNQFPYETLVSPPFALMELESAFLEAASRRWPRIAVKSAE